MKPKNIFFAIICVALLATGSCHLVGPGKVPYSECCNFNTESCVIKVNCTDEKISAVKILISDPDSIQKFADVYYDTTLVIPANELIVPLPPDSLMKSKRFNIKIWTHTNVIDDYRIEVNSQDWQSKKIIYGVYNYR